MTYIQQVRARLIITFEPQGSKSDAGALYAHGGYEKSGATVPLKRQGDRLTLYFGELKGEPINITFDVLEVDNDFGYYAYLLHCRMLEGARLALHRNFKACGFERVENS
ncbi:MAG: hypothetical protein ACKKL4_00460 [Patescibacteria group bacterium]